MKTQQKPIHHSAADWDFEHEFWELSFDHYISPPSSVAMTSWRNTAILSRHPAAQNLPQGQISTWLRVERVTDDNAIMFRNQQPFDTADDRNTYWVMAVDLTLFTFRRCVNDVITNLGEWLIPFPLQEWFRWRVTWWNGIDEHGDPALVVRLDLWENGEWVDKGERYDPVNKWKDSDLNRCGLLLWDTLCYFDDTEIWRPV